jgi:hypothetical protein
VITSLDGHHVSIRQDGPLLPAGPSYTSPPGTTTPTTISTINPKNWVGRERTIDEMSFAWVSLYYLDDFNSAARASQERRKQVDAAPEMNAVWIVMLTGAFAPARKVQLPTYSGAQFSTVGRSPVYEAGCKQRQHLYVVFGPAEIGGKNFVPAGPNKIWRPPDACSATSFVRSRVFWVLGAERWGQRELVWTIATAARKRRATDAGDSRTA